MLINVKYLFISILETCNAMRMISSLCMMMGCWGVWGAALRLGQHHFSITF